jgi:hypothetical protein
MENGQQSISGHQLLVPVPETGATATEQNALVPFNPTGPSAEVMEIMKRVVSLKSEEKYRNENIFFLLLINGSCDEIKNTLLEEWFIEKMSDAVIADGNRRCRPNARKACKEALDGINMHTGNCPVILPALTFNMFSNYLTSRKKEVVFTWAKQHIMAFAVLFAICIE